MTGHRKSTRLGNLPKKVVSKDSESIDPDASDGGGSDYEDPSKGSHVRPLKGSIEGVDKSEVDDEVQLLYKQSATQQDWVPASAVPRTIVKAWTQDHSRFSKSIGDKTLPAIEGGAIRGDNEELHVYFRKGGKDRNGQHWPYNLVSASAVPLDILKEWAKKHKVYLRKGQDLEGKDIIVLSPAGWDIVDGSNEEVIPPVRPDSVSPTPSSSGEDDCANG